MDERSLLWLAGFLEGEGSFLRGTPSAPRSPRITAVTTDRDVADRVGALLGVRVHPVKSRSSHHRQAYAIALKGHRAVALMKDLRPLMGERRQAAIDSAIASADGARDYGQLAEVRQRIAEEYRDHGGSYRQIAKKFGVSHTVVFNVVHKAL